MPRQQTDGYQPEPGRQSNIISVVLALGLQVSKCHLENLAVLQGDEPKASLMAVEEQNAFQISIYYPSC